MTASLPTDPKSRSELAHWLEERKRILKLQGLPADTPLTPREYLMVQRLTAKRPAYSLT